MAEPAQVSHTAPDSALLVMSFSDANPPSSRILDAPQVMGTEPTPADPFSPLDPPSSTGFGGDTALSGAAVEDFGSAPAGFGGGAAPEGAVGFGSESMPGFGDGAEKAMDFGFDAAPNMA
eukprot:797824-Rhodomonas_salina.3